MSRGKRDLGKKDTKDRGQERETEREQGREVLIGKRYRTREREVPRKRVAKKEKRQGREVPWKRGIKR